MNAIVVARRIQFSWLFLLVAGLLSGCAGVDYTTIHNDAEDKTARGLRYFDSSPYLLVQTDNQGGLSSQFMYLPDQTKKRQATPHTFLASNTTTVTFNNGVLTDSTSDTDSSAVPAAIIKALDQTATAAVKMLTADQPLPSNAPRVYIFKIVKKDGVWGLEGAEGDDVPYKAVAH